MILVSSRGHSEEYYLLLEITSNYRTGDNIPSHWKSYFIDVFGLAAAILGYVIVTMFLDRKRDIEKEMKSFCIEVMRYDQMLSNVTN